MNTFVDLLEERASELGRARLFCYLSDGVSTEETLSYGAALARARRIGAALAEMAAPGGRVLLLYPSGLEFIEAFLGTMCAGLIPVPAYPPNTREPNASVAHLSRIVQNCSAELVLTTRVLARKLLSDGEISSSLLSRPTWICVEDLDLPSANDWRRPDIGPDSVALLQYTSGSTANPKGTMLTHGGLIANLKAIQEAFVAGKHGFTVASWLPLYHDLGLIGCVLAPVYTRAQLVFMSPQHFIQRPIRWLRMIDKYGAYISGAPNFAFDLCSRAITDTAKQTLDLSRWKIAANCSEPIRLSTLKRFEAAFAPSGFRWTSFCPAYGLAESTLLVTAARPRTGPTVIQASDPGKGDAAAERSCVSSGRAPSGVEIAIVDPVTLRVADEGEIWVSSRSLAIGYWNNSAQSAATFVAGVPGLKGGPWLRTGDLGRMHHGELVVTGRLKDLIIVGGRKIHPQDVEDVVQSIDRRIRQSAGSAFGCVKDGTEQLMLVQEVSNCTREQLSELAKRARIAVYDNLQILLHTIAFVPAGGVPKTLNGKLRRSQCKALFETAELPGAELFSSQASEALHGSDNHY
ncbi:fatty acyl-AMP ligase [Bradyrhizobium sp. SZCCHNR2035]|uniref:fatty acyl-AMP ligase n=1 Tax=Bradyrhizobium sp. SZCCHNR2035 TaxID=3057386 RepID=UPI0029161713|nr:fatty acyl-AMP ligase [Bradyrhizobium sp. SZCCHNR2035]